MTERLHFQFSLSCIGEGNDNSHQCSQGWGNLCDLWGHTESDTTEVTQHQQWITEVPLLHFGFLANLNLSSACYIAVILLHFQTLGVLSSSIIFLGFCLAMPWNLWEIWSTTRCWTLAIGSESIKSAEPPGNSHIFFFLSFKCLFITWLCRS